MSNIVALDDTEVPLTYGELIYFCANYKNIIKERTLIFILSENSIGSFVGYTAALSNKIVPLLVNSKIDRELLDNLICKFHPEYLWIPDVMKDSFNYGVVYSAYNYCLLKTGLSSPPLYSELSLLLPTSGSTGSSKLVRHSYRNIEANAENVSSLFELSEKEKALITLPMYYTMGLSIITSHLHSGATVLLTKRSLTDPQFWSFVKRTHATSFSGVPYSYEILNKLHFFRMTLPDLTTLNQGGGRMSDDLFQNFAKYAENQGKKFIATYGQTEGTARMAYLPAELALKKTCSIGYSVPNGRLFLIDETGEIIEDNEAVGQMVYQGENVTLGYASSADDLIKGDENNGILYTGDIARRDVDGCYYIIGRMGRFLKLYGLRVSLDESEQIIKDHFKIDCACVGTDKCMYVYIEQEFYTNDIIKLLVEKTNIIASAFKIVCINKIPKNEAGKTLYNKLNKE